MARSGVYSRCEDPVRQRTRIARSAPAVHCHGGSTRCGTTSARTTGLGAAPAHGGHCDSAPALRLWPNYTQGQIHGGPQDLASWLATYGGTGPKKGPVLLQSTRVNKCVGELEDDLIRRLETPSRTFGQKADRLGDKGYRSIETLSAWHEEYNGKAPSSGAEHRNWAPSPLTVDAINGKTRSYLFI